ncbi:hypothetical protein ACVILH_006515 [Bradyrhizobium sp. USDA 4353]
MRLIMLLALMGAMLASTAAEATDWRSRRICETLVQHNYFADLRACRVAQHEVFLTVCRLRQEKGLKQSNACRRSHA